MQRVRREGMYLIVERIFLSFVRETRISFLYVSSRIIHCVEKQFQTSKFFVVLFAFTHSGNTITLLRKKCHFKSTWNTKKESGLYLIVYVSNIVLDTFINKRKHLIAIGSRCEYTMYVMHGVTDIRSCLYTRSHRIFCLLL